MGNNFNEWNELEIGLVADTHVYCLQHVQWNAVPVDLT